jgi:hypothetical protein
MSALERFADFNRTLPLARDVPPTDIAEHQFASYAIGSNVNGGSWLHKRQAPI